MRGVTGIVIALNLGLLVLTEGDAVHWHNVAVSKEPLSYQEKSQISYGNAHQTASITGQNVSRQSQDSGACHDGDCSPNSNLSWFNLTTILAVLAVIAYFAQTVLMRATLVHSNRAYVHIGTWDRHPDLDTAGKVVRWKINARLENRGNSPTKNLRYTSTNVKANTELPKGYRFKDYGDIFRSVIGPGNYMLLGDIIVIPEDLIPSNFIYVYGWATYRDVFFLTRERRTEFCYRIYAYGDPTDKDCSFGYFFHGEYNNADEECDRERRIRNALKEPDVNTIMSGKIPLGTALFEIGNTPASSLYPKSLRLDIPTIRM